MQQQRQPGGEPARAGEAAGGDLCLHLYCIQVSSTSPVPPRGATTGIFLVREGRLQAVASMVSRSEFSDVNLTNAAWLLPRLQAHEQTIEQLMDAADVVPSRFGTLFSSADALRNRLRNEEPRLLALLERLAGAEEWAAELTYANPSSLQSSAESQARPTSGKDFLLAKSRQRLEQQRSQDEAARAGEVLLSELAEQARELQRVPAPIAKAALLVTRTSRDRFLEQARQVAQRAQQQGLHLRCTGPWPPYSFCDDRPPRKEAP